MNNIEECFNIDMWLHKKKILQYQINDLQLYKRTFDKVDIEALYRAKVKQWYEVKVKGVS